jgi:hypothetical protein
MRSQAFDVKKQPCRVWGVPAADRIWEHCQAKLQGEAASTKQLIGPAVKTASPRAELLQLIALAEGEGSKGRCKAGEWSRGPYLGVQPSFRVILSAGTRPLKRAGLGPVTDEPS